MYYGLKALYSAEGSLSPLKALYPLKAPYPAEGSLLVEGSQLYCYAAHYRVKCQQRVARLGFFLAYLELL